jgi:hypothetical protein
MLHLTNPLIVGHESSTQLMWTTETGHNRESVPFISELYNWSP